MKTTRKLLFGKTLLIAFVATIVSVILLVYVSGLSSHRSILENTWISGAVLTISFFLFLCRGLFIGLNVVDDYSHKLQIYWKNRRRKNRIDASNAHGFEIPDFDGDSIVGAIIVWILLTIAFVLFLSMFEVVIWAAMLLIVLAIYWVFIRALKLVFAKSAECEGDLIKSTGYALFYTVLYVGWIFLIIYASTLI